MSADRKRALKKNSKMIPVIVLSVTVLVISTLLLINALRNSINTAVYTERKQLLSRLTQSSAYIVNDNINYGESIAKIFADDAENDMLRYAALNDFIAAFKTRSVYSGMLFFFVDSNGKYYSSDGVCGKMKDILYYSDGSGDIPFYISNLPHMAEEDSYLIFRNRFTKPLSIMTENGMTELRYCGLLFDINALKDTLAKEFNGANNTFIYDASNGVMLYKHFGIKLLLDGYNIYTKFEKCDIAYGGTPAELKEACHSGHTVVMQFAVGGEDYYFCSSPLTHSRWAVAYIVQEKYLDDDTDNSFTKTAMYITLIVVILGAAVFILLALSYRHSITEENLVNTKRINVELEKATNAKSDFLSNMSHDIRTPINGIMGMVAIARRVPGNPEKTEECLVKIDNASHHLLSLINDVLDMSRIERGKTEITRKPIDIRMVADNCCSIIRGQMTGRNLTLECEIQCEHPRLLGDDLHLRQIFINILGNAVKFTHDGGTIWFRCLEKDASDSHVILVFEIEDTGIGMKPEFLPHIFDAFTQDEGGARSSYKGTGLGMAITKQLTELMGGRIGVESELDKGSKFTLTIPFLLDTSPQTMETADEKTGDIQGMRLLLAEDNELNMEIATELLQDAGATITAVTDGKQALDAFANNLPDTFDAILMDIMMPEMNGLDAARAIRSLPRKDASTIPIIAMTANAFESDIQSTINAGMNAHLAKPIDIAQVISTVSRYARKD